MSVFAMASSVAGFVKVRYLMDKAVIDNMVFRLHYRVTSAMLFVNCVLVTANNLIGRYAFQEIKICRMLLKKKLFETTLLIRKRW